MININEMKDLLLTLVIGGSALCAFAAKPSDPVALTVDGRDVHLSEFEYLYNKNNTQQLEPVTFDEYVDMFVNYKLKVADALHARLDTTASFIAEFEKFRSDLARPYLRDTLMEEQLIEEAFAHTQKDRFVSHIMLDARQPDAKQKIDSIRAAILDGKISFEQAAKDNSVDKRSGENGGRMGWLSGTGLYPWPFEKAAYDTSIGQMSEVVNSGIGYHLIRPEEERTPKGEVQVSHILLLTQGMDDEAKAVVKQRIDSIYEVVTNGADFAEVARKESQDPGSARQGGMLDWFGPGRMVAEFDSVSFALAPGQISKPFATSYGYHIVNKHAQRGGKTLDEMRPTIKSMMERDGRINQPVLAKIAEIAKASGSSIDNDYMNSVNQILSANGNNPDSMAIAQIKQSTAIAYVANNKKVTLAEALNNLNTHSSGMPLDAFKSAIENQVENSFNKAMLEIGLEQLYNNNSEYRNLVNEYRDGILLFDISNREVWERASNDSTGLANYYDTHRDSYNNWEKPRFKGYVIFATNDSILNSVQAFVENNNLKNLSQNDLTTTLKKEFGKNVKVERVVVAKGDNQIIDYLAFGGSKPENSNKTWKSYFPYDYKIIDQPEEVNDVRAAVITDYQSALEKEWIKDLHKKYNVKINKKVLKPNK